MQARPRARSEGIIVEKLDDGAVIYDLVTDRAHRLDSPATRLWDAADGSRDARELAATVGLDEAAVQVALDELEARSLLVSATRLSRRAVLSRAAAVSAAAIAAVPLIETVIIPTAAAHASALAPPHYSPPLTPPGEFPPLHRVPGRKSHRPPVHHHKRPKRRRRRRPVHKHRRPRRPPRSPGPRFTG